jgi:hypothetical protein
MGKALNLLAGLVSCISASHADAQVGQPNPVVGSWYQYEWVGFFPDETGKCLFASIVQRRYDVTVSQDIVGGTYSTHERRLAFRQQGECRFAGRIPQAAEFLAQRTWGLEGYSDATGTRVQGRFLGCILNGCDAPGMFKGGFTTKLEVGSMDELVEREEGSDRPARVFRPPSAFSTELGEVRKTVDRIVDAFASGDFAEMQPLLAGQTPSNLIEQFRIWFPTQTETFRRVDSLETILEHSMDPPTTGDFASATRIAYVYYGAVLSDGQKMPLPLVLLQDSGGQWKMVPI